MEKEKIPPRIDEQGRILAAVVIIERITSEGILEILLLKRDPRWSFPNVQSLTGGKVDKGDTIVDTAVKETKQETGLVVDPYKLKLIDVCESQYKLKIYKSFVFVAQQPEGTLCSFPTPEHTEGAFKPVDERIRDENISFEVKQLLLRYYPGHITKEKIDWKAIEEHDLRLIQEK